MTTDRDAVAAALAAHVVCAKTDEDTLCRCDRRWRRDGEYRAHLADVLAPLLAQARAEAVAAALAPVERLADEFGAFDSCVDAAPEDAESPEDYERGVNDCATRLHAAVAEGKEASRG